MTGFIRASKTPLPFEGREATLKDWRGSFETDPGRHEPPLGCLVSVPDALDLENWGEVVVQDHEFTRELTSDGEIFVPLEELAVADVYGKPLFDPWDGANFIVRRRTKKGGNGSKDDLALNPRAKMIVRHPASGRNRKRPKANGS